MVVIAVLKVELSLGEFSSGPLTFLLGLVMAYLSSPCFVVKGGVVTHKFGLGSCIEGWW